MRAHGFNFLKRIAPGLLLPMQITRITCYRAAILVLAAVSGCGSSEELNRQAVSGSVTFDGKPLASGAILFEPVTAESGTAVGAVIRKGTFTISAKDGPVPGSYQVRIYASSGIQARPTKGQIDHSSRPMVESLPEHYNSKTELRADVTGVRANRFQFDLSSSKSTDARQSVK
jgi:hypothetical protein